MRTFWHNYPPLPPWSSQNQRNWEILVMLIQDKADTEVNAGVLYRAEAARQQARPACGVRESYEAVGQNPKLTSTPSGCCCCYLWLSGTVLENELCSWHCTAVKSSSLGRPAEAWVSACGIIPLDSSSSPPWHKSETLEEDLVLLVS